MSTTSDRIKVMQAKEDGKCIQYIPVDDSHSAGWLDYPKCGTPEWQWMSFNYRVKSNPDAKVGDVLRTNGKVPPNYFDTDVVQVIYVRDTEDEVAYLCVDNNAKALKEHEGATTNDGKGVWWVRKGQYHHTFTAAAEILPDPVFEYINIYSKAGDSGSAHLNRHPTRALAESRGSYVDRSYLGTLKVEVK